MAPDLERAARALFDKRYDSTMKKVLFDNGDLTFDQLKRGVEEGFFVPFILDSLADDVRAVLLAIREPSEIAEAAFDLETAYADMSFREKWQAMIDVILGEKPT